MKLTEKEIASLKYLLSHPGIGRNLESAMKTLTSKAQANIWTATKKIQDAYIEVVIKD